SPEDRRSEITRRARAQGPNAYVRKSSNRSLAVRYGSFRLRSFRRCELCRRPVQTQLRRPQLYQPDELTKPRQGFRRSVCNPKCSLVKVTRLSPAWKGINLSPFSCETGHPPRCEEGLPT